MTGASIGDSLHGTCKVTWSNGSISYETFLNGQVHGIAVNVGLYADVSYDRFVIEFRNGFYSGLHTVYRKTGRIDNMHLLNGSYE